MISRVELVIFITFGPGLSLGKCIHFQLNQPCRFQLCLIFQKGSALTTETK